MTSLHENLDPIKAFVREDVLYNMDPAYNKYIPCEIVGVSSYENCAPTFQIVLDNNSIFYDIPPHLLSLNSGNILAPLTLKELVYHNCPSTEFVFYKSNYIKDAFVFFKGQLNTWLDATYLFSIDWNKNNSLLHALKLSNGQICFMPNHKISLSKKELPKYKKLKTEWRV